VLQQIPQMPRVAPIGRRLANDHRPDLGGFPHQPRVSLGLEQRVKPEGIAGGLDAHGHRSGESRIEAFDAVPLVDQFLLVEFPRLGIQNRDLLLAAMQIATDQDHEGGLLSRGGAALGLPERSNCAGPFS
jgi:hypothetical protein